MINQLFKQVPDKEFLIKLLKCFGLTGLDDTNEFTKNMLFKINIIDKINNLLPELVIYYLPCKYNFYLNNLTINKCITILKQILKLFKYQIKKREYVINKIKINYFYLFKKLSSNILIQTNCSKCLVKFN
jgi:hypothetical protein|tara:strand:- start:2069 stop:2458 length:390 start_codon:yes stop_codon:yes gene_type:complete